MSSLTKIFFNRIKTAKFFAERYAPEGRSPIDKFRLYLAGCKKAIARKNIEKDTSNNVYFFSLTKTFPYQVGIDPRNHWHSAIFYEIFPKEAYDLKSVGFYPEVVIDVGAHIGLFALLCKSKWPNASLIAIEPDPINLKILTKNFDQNKIPATIIYAAASDRNGFIPFTSAAGMGAIAEKSTDNDEVVPCINCAQLLEIYSNRKRLIKIDVEGAEHTFLDQVLRSLKSTDFLFIEVHGESIMHDRFLQTCENLSLTVEKNTAKFNKRKDEWYTDYSVHKPK